MLNSEEPDQGVNEMFHPFAKGRIPHRGEPMSCKMQWVSRRLLAPSKEVCPEEPKWCRIRCCSKLTCDLSMDFFSMIFCISSVVFYLGTRNGYTFCCKLTCSSVLVWNFRNITKMSIRCPDPVTTFQSFLFWNGLIRVPQPQRHFNTHLAAATSHDRGKRIGWSDLAKVGKGRYLLLIRHRCSMLQPGLSPKVVMAGDEEVAKQRVSSRMLLCMGPASIPAKPQAQRSCTKDLKIKKGMNIGQSVQMVNLHRCQIYIVITCLEALSALKQHMGRCNIDWDMLVSGCCDSILW